MPSVDSTSIIREFKSIAPHLTIDVVYTSITDQEGYLLDGRVDVCFVRLPISSPSLKVMPLFPEPRVAALPTGYPRATAEAVSIEESRDPPLLQDPARFPNGVGRVLGDHPIRIGVDLDHLRSRSGLAMKRGL